ncbi:cytochrome bd-type quinol oxidase, subunit 2 [Mycobacterium sp. JS623]|uniref:DUF3043 domain-containing protein n=1 Tax=Mycobacterium sp. JS623 TaxID=212767 RepID=UPI0002A59F1F|nr:DUF3043 domain-containing protein [Mycobacterium sp. JS623]AGB24172.1 cytochrome bd-type quinol oxidase, subunit 2 [Mycobacterium sp. JS623]
MKLLGRKKDNSDLDKAADEADSAVDATPQRAGTAPKGRPTPKRDQGKRGPIAPAPMTAAEARKRRKETGAKLTREEKKAASTARRADMAERREKMMAGEDAYLLPRDKGPVRRFVRDVVDSRRNLLGLFMPAALGLIFIMLSVPSPAVQLPLSFAMPVLIVIMLIDALFLGRKVNKLVDTKFPDNTESGWKLGFYAASRASQLRRMRAPRPQVNRGDSVS